MHVLVNVPASLCQYCDGQRRLDFEFQDACTLRDVLQRLHDVAPGVAERALDEQGRIRPHVNVFLDGQSIRAGSQLGLQTPVAAGAEVWILPAVSGG